MVRALKCGVALGAGAVLVLQGCGGGGGGGGPSGGNTTTTTALRPAAATTTTTVSVGPSGLYWCEDIGTNYKATYDSKGTKSAAGQCLPSATPGAYYTKPGQKDRDGKSDRPWGCFSPSLDHSLWTDKAARAQNFEGACLFKDYSSRATPESIDDCSKHLSHHPSVCAPGPSMYWGACWSSHSESWTCVPHGDRTIPGLAKGDCKARVLQEPAPSTKPTKYFYDGVCRFDKPKATMYKCDTVPDYDKAQSGYCGQSVDTRTDKACFSLKSGVQWECFDEKTPFATPCDWTLQPGGSKDDYYRGACVFPRNKAYDEAIDAHNLTAGLRQQVVV
jgi:hypothetical protein